eukprot:TRINITY_DN2437_c0_g1_i1.p1 TRINITY_DN2437_c0_g1~~TRINITY_DN2437_c0_g1_i1.p1  ORF type:complete len:119 (-),score=0.15 TRINITY_DN2437_c0_g1_i1:131-487(-)
MVVEYHFSSRMETTCKDEKVAPLAWHFATMTQLCTVTKSATKTSGARCTSACATLTACSSAPVPSKNTLLILRAAISTGCHLVMAGDGNLDLDLQPISLDGTHYTLNHNLFCRRLTRC